MQDTMTISDLKYKLENGEFGFKYSKNKLFKYLLGDWNDGQMKRVGIVVSFQFEMLALDNYKLYLDFKRLETNYSAGIGEVVLHHYEDTFQDFEIVKMEWHNCRCKNQPCRNSYFETRSKTFFANINLFHRL